MSRRISVWDVLVWVVYAEAYVESLGGKLEVDLESITVDPKTETGYIDMKLVPPTTLNFIKVDLTI